jgi:hypothetical protein
MRLLLDRGKLNREGTVNYARMDVLHDEYDEDTNAEVMIRFDR